MDAPSWDKALCTRVSSKLRSFWTSDDPTQRETARLACFSCVIREACAEWAIQHLSYDSHKPDLAVWGGMRPIERRRRREAYLAERRERWERREQAG